MRLQRLMTAGAVSLGLLGSCLSVAQAAAAPVRGSDTTAVHTTGDAVPLEQDSVLLPENLDESSQALDDELSLPLPEAL